MELIIVIAVIVGILLLVIGAICKSPFNYPYFEKYIDVTGRRNPQVSELLDEFISKDRMVQINRHQQLIEQWKSDCQQKVQESKLHNLRQRQYEDAIDDTHAYRFTLYRRQTKYKQVNYTKTAYKVNNDIASYTCDYSYLANRNTELSKIGYETSLKKYFSKQQRCLMTSQLRRQIIERDNYTCQICGRYMPDEFGLEVDHIVPVAKGGKSVPSNLQVLCIKCNRSKHDKWWFENNNQIHQS